MTGSDFCQDRSVALDAPLDRPAADELCYAYVPREDSVSLPDPWQRALDDTCPDGGTTCVLSPSCPAGP